jgi:hypothetical protein
MLYFLGWDQETGSNLLIDIVKCGLTAPLEGGPSPAADEVGRTMPEILPTKASPPGTPPKTQG